MLIYVWNSVRLWKSYILSKWYLNKDLKYELFWSLIYTLRTWDLHFNTKRIFTREINYIYIYETRDPICIYSDLMHAQNIYACSQQITKIFKSNNGGFIQLEANAQKDCGILYIFKKKKLAWQWVWFELYHRHLVTGPPSIIITISRCRSSIRDVPNCSN